LASLFQKDEVSAYRHAQIVAVCNILVLYEQGRITLCAYGKNACLRMGGCVLSAAGIRNSRTIDILLTLLRIGLGVFFLITGIQKIGDLGQTAEFLTRSDLLPEFFSMPLACIGVAMELVVAVCLVFRISYRGAAVWGVVMTAVFLLLYAQAWARGLSLSCNCMGSDHEIVNFPQDTGVRLLLLGAMLLLVWDSRRRDSLASRKPRKFDFSEA
jgi:uncharacterized membrane protein YphA (DoxX/SURF4 family)